MGGIYNTYICPVSMQKFDLEALHGRSSTDRQSTSLRPYFGDIFTLNADYIAWKLLKMALEVQYMMGVPASYLLTLAIVFKVTLGLLK